MQEFSCVRRGELVEQILLKEILIVFEVVRGGFGVVFMREVGGFIEEFIKISGY
jgi:hypothetical protein